MPRIERIDVGGYVYHILNRANARVQIFDTTDDYFQFEEVLEEAVEKSERRSMPFGDPTWTSHTVKKFSLDQTMRGVGRPKKI